MHIKIIKLEEQLENRTEIISSSLSYSCEYCELSVHTHNILKEHMELVHIAAAPRTPEKERESSHDISLELVTSHEKRLEDDIEQSPPPTSISKQKCTSNQCTNEAANFFSSTNIFKVNYKNIFICDTCTRSIPLKELRKNPTIKV